METLSSWDLLYPYIWNLYRSGILLQIQITAISISDIFQIYKILTTIFVIPYGFNFRYYYL